MTKMFFYTLVLQKGLTLIGMNNPQIKMPDFVFVEATKVAKRRFVSSLPIISLVT